MVTIYNLKLIGYKVFTDCLLCPWPHLNYHRVPGKGELENRFRLTVKWNKGLSCRKDILLNCVALGTKLLGWGFKAALS